MSITFTHLPDIRVDGFSTYPEFSVCFLHTLRAIIRQTEASKRVPVDIQMSYKHDRKRRNRPTTLSKPLYATKSITQHTQIHTFRPIRLFTLTRQTHSLQLLKACQKTLLKMSLFAGLLIGKSYTTTKRKEKMVILYQKHIHNVLCDTKYISSTSLILMTKRSFLEHNEPDGWKGH